MIADIKKIAYPTQFKDNRGEYLELFNKKFLIDNNINEDFIQSCVSLSEKHVLRGIHGDFGTAKLITCISGQIQYAFVDNRPESKTFGQIEHGILNSEDHILIYLPKGIGNSYLTLSERSTYFYSQNTYYGDFEQFTLFWNDPKFAIPWRVANPIVSKRDGG